LRNFRASSFALDQYHRFEEIEAYLKQLQRENSLVSLKLLGHTLENREINAVRISSGGDSKRPAILIDAGIHAREWVAPATALYLINTLATKYNSDPQVKTLVDSFDWYIVPVVNPDGYAYTWKTNRGWRKNRSRPQPFSGCYGVDPNRNFELGFGGASTSKNPCSDIYPGPSPFSESESRAVRKLTLDTVGRMRVIITLHSFGQMWMSPWGYVNSRPADYTKMTSAANKAVAALRAVHGTSYKVGAIYEVIYPTGGGSIDWQYSVGNTSYAYAVELRPNSNNFNGFELPRTQIIPTAQEIWAAVSTLANSAK
jgi:murein tripeptide amidase MpaA